MNKHFSLTILRAFLIPFNVISTRKDYLCSMEEERLDKLLVQLNLVNTRVRAEKIIKEDGVKVNGVLITKTGKRFPIDSKIELMSEETPWVSRGALKLFGALEKWPIEIDGKTFMDIGASIGGFTEVLLKNGASKVFCVDVNRDQLHVSIKGNQKVINLDKTHVRELNSKLITEQVDGCVVDISLLSLDKVFPFIHAFIRPNGTVFVLINPRFEADKEHVGKNGIVKDKKLFPEILEKIKRLGKGNNLEYIDQIESPILGEDGNQEFIMYFSKVGQ